MDKDKQVDLKKRFSGVSATSLGHFKIHPKYFKNYVDKVLEEDTPKYFELGTQTHMYILEPEKFKESYTFLDFTKPRGDNQSIFCEKIAEHINNGSKVNSEILISAYKSTYSTAAKKSDEKSLEEAKKLYKQLSKYISYLITRDKFKEVLNYTTFNYLKEIKQNVLEHVKAKELLFNDNDIIDDPDLYTVNEKRILWEHPTINVNGKPLVCKSFIDRLVIDFKNKKVILIDLKTSNSLHEFEEKFEAFNYKNQMAFYWMAIAYYFKTELPEHNLKDFSFETYAVVLQTPNMYKDYPITCKVYPISEDTLNEGYKEIDDLLNDIKWHTEENKWEHRRSYYDNNGLEKAL